MPLWCCPNHKHRLHRYNPKVTQLCGADVARKFGIRSAMPGYIGKRLCPELVFVQPDFSKYVRWEPDLHDNSWLHQVLKSSLCSNT